MDAQDFETWFSERATPDVAAAVAWLEERGFIRSGEQVGTMDSGLARYSADDVTVVVVRDRGVWMADLVHGGTSVDLDAVSAARQGLSQWGKSNWRVPLPDQLPKGVSWRSEIPLCIAWIQSSDEAHERIREVKALRSKEI